jgi:hypothetical protein
MRSAKKYLKTTPSNPWTRSRIKLNEAILYIGSKPKKWSNPSFPFIVGHSDAEIEMVLD